MAQRTASQTIAITIRRDFGYWMRDRHPCQQD